MRIIRALRWFPCLAIPSLGLVGAPQASAACVWTIVNAYGSGSNSRVDSGQIAGPQSRG